MTPRNRLARQLIGAGAVILVFGAVFCSLMAIWMSGWAPKSETVRTAAEAVVALGLAIGAYGRWRQLG